MAIVVKLILIETEILAAQRLCKINFSLPGISASLVVQLQIDKRSIMIVL